MRSGPPFTLNLMIPRPWLHLIDLARKEQTSATRKLRRSRVSSNA